jgi:uncharacterized protein (TIGR00730 family)
VPKLTMFGSARTHQSDPLYAQAKDLAGRVAAAGWLVVTGAGPGIMAAGHEGAGLGGSLGVEIRLPFESASHPELAAEGRLVEMKYFFTRKLMLMKESAAFAVLPGGFGTLDETFETVTWLQLGLHDKPVGMLDVDGFWQPLMRWIERAVADGFVPGAHAAALHVHAGVGPMLDALAPRA